MTFSIIIFVLSWICFLVFGDKKRFIELSPTCYLAMYFACTTDMMTNVYPLWEYPASDKLHVFYRHVLHDTGIYPVVTYLFLQTLPEHETAFYVVRHIFYWSLLAISVEAIAMATNNMEHHLWWNFGWSYTSDWVLYGIFYAHFRWRRKNSRG